MVAAEAPGRPGSLRRVLAKQVVWVTGGRLLAALLQAALLILVARALEVDEFGYLMAFVGVVTLAQVSVDCGVQTYISRERAATPDSGGVATALRFTVYSSLLLTTLFAVGLALAAASISDLYWAMLPLALWGAAERSADMRFAVAFADGDVHIPILNLVARRSSTIALFLAGSAVIDEPILAFSIASAVSALASALAAGRIVRRRVTAPSDITFGQLLRAARPYWLTSIALQARNLDVLVVSASSGGSVQAGLYSSGSRLINPLQILPLSLAAVLLPASARSDSSRRALKRLYLLTVGVVAVLGVVYAGIFAATPFLVLEGLGERYEGSVAVIRIILLGLPFSSAAAMFSAVLQGRGRGRSVAASTTTSTVFALVGIAIVTPSSGAAGAAAVLSCSFVVQLLAMSVAMRRLWVESDR